MKISILLPTRNGGDQLETCVRSVLDQSDAELELVVSDNASDAPTREVLVSFDDPRLTLVRQEEMLSVTDNWSATLNAATGDYVLLIGDDDALLPGSVNRMLTLLEEFARPDVLSFEAYGFAF